LAEGKDAGKEDEASSDADLVEENSTKNRKDHVRHGINRVEKCISRRVHVELFFKLHLKWAGVIIAEV